MSGNATPQPPREESVAVATKETLPDDAQKFLQITSNHVPTRRAAKKVYAQYVQVLKSLSNENWKRFFALQRHDETPVDFVLENPAVAAVNPADHAYCLMSRLQDLDKPWWKRYGKKASLVLGVPVVGTGLTLLTQNWETVVGYVSLFFTLIVVSLYLVYWLNVRSNIV